MLLEDVAEAYIPDGSRLCLLPAPEDRDGNGLPVSPKHRTGLHGKKILLGIREERLPYRLPELRFP